MGDLGQSGSQASRAKHQKQNQHENHERPFLRKQVVLSLYWLCPPGIAEFHQKQGFLGNIRIVVSPRATNGLKVNGPFTQVQGILKKFLGEKNSSRGDAEPQRYFGLLARKVPLTRSPIL